MINSDLYFSESGDLAVSPEGDIAITDSNELRLQQQSQTRLATQRADFICYPNLGADLHKLVGLPNTPDTARFGKTLIMNALTRDNFLQASNIDVQATPTRPDVIQFEIKIYYGSNEYISITIDQLLGV